MKNRLTTWVKRLLVAIRIKKELIVVIILALTTRLTWVVYWNGDTTGIDVGRYLDQARSIAYYGSFMWQGVPTAVNGPLFPAFLSFFFIKTRQKANSTFYWRNLSTHYLVLRLYILLTTSRITYLAVR